MQDDLDRANPFVRARLARSMPRVIRASITADVADEVEKLCPDQTWTEVVQTALEQLINDRNTR